MSTIVISQPMFFPWVGLFEQIRLADIYVHYDDVQFPQGRSFIHRVQIKHQDGPHWLTAPVQRHEKKLIKDIQLDNTQNWRERHLKTLRHCYTKAPYSEEMLGLVASIYQNQTAFLWELNRTAIETIAAYFGLKPKFLISSDLNTSSHSSQKLLDTVLKIQGTRYITGHGAKNYLNHGLFEAHGITVEYMEYQCIPYPQFHGKFNPYVSILDLIAHRGSEGVEFIQSGTVNWRMFIQDGPHQPIS